MFTITVDSKLVMDELARLQQRTSNLRPVMDSIGQELNNRISARFETHTDPLGHAWAPWKKSTRKSYPKDGHGVLLQRHGTMLQSLTFNADNTSVQVGFSAVASKAGDVYAAYHEWGTKKMPRRGLLFADPNARTLSPGDETAILDIINLYLAQK